MTTGARKTILPSGRVQPRFAGISTFLRIPHIDDVAPENRPIDWAIYGIPSDAGVTFRPGARFGPRAIRAASQYIKPYLIEQAVHLAEKLSLADAGDSPVSPYSCKQTLEDASLFASRLGDPKHTKLFAIGGDHSIAFANLKATYERRGKPSGGLAIIHFDAHMDTVDEVWGEKWGHASPFRRAIEAGYIDPKSMISIGIRGTLNDPADLNYAKQQGVTLITFDEWRKNGPQLLAAFISKLAKRETYLTFDVDAVDPAFCPGTGTPVAGGFTSAEALAAIRSLRGINLVGADIVEVLPDRDVSEITATFAAQLLAEILGLNA
ncbi:MAG: agmatinase [Planctomycetes bacterium]|nr:agmatinase [Planctomycetota bacterium]